MKRCIALLAAAALVLATTAVNPCKRQPFRGRCPSKNGETPKRSQFVLRYYMRNGECVSYPYGHCSSDDGEPQLHRYKEECEDACINPPPANLGFPKAFIDQTYGTVGPLPNLNELTEAAAEMVETTSITTTEGKTTQQITSESTKFTTSDLPTTITDLSTQQHSASTTESSTTEVIVTQASTIKPSTTEASTTEASITEIFTKNFSTTEALSTEVFTTAIIAETTTDVPTVKVSTTEVFHDQEAITIPIKKGSKQATSTQQIPASPVTAHSTITDNDSSSALNIPETTITLQESTEEIIIQTTTPTTRTECQRQRAAATASTIKGGFVPICTPQGAFEMMQCEPDARQCFCVDHNGITIANSRTKNGQKPDCAKIQSAISPKIEECIGEASRGPCVSTFNRWFYDENEQICKQFIYSGCGGNGNNYETEKACTHRCAPPPMGLPKCDKGEPLKSKSGVAVNCAKSNCPSGYKCSIVQQASVCCPENDKILGLQTSEPNNICLMPKERGPCDKYELRFYYNADLKECKYFFWGGCEGNGNNFDKAEDCESTCGLAKNKESSPITVATTTAIPSRRANIRTTQGIRITPKGQHLREETTEVTTPITSTTSQKPVPVVHIHQVTRTPPVPETALLEGSEETADSVNRCLHPKDPGNCRGQFIRWYWDNDRKVCDVFTYSGCQGNGNNYASREECLAICHKEAAPIVVADFSNVCKQDVDAGECNGVFQRFAFDTDSGECRSFTYGGCGGNGNNFATITECRNKCQKVAQSPGNLCEHEIETGECSGVFVRYGYDKTVNDCRQFTYGGCGGNGNNFATVQECRNVCVKKVCNPNPQCDLARCQIVNDRNGCPFCSCPPVKQPLPPDSEKPHCPIIDVDKCKEPCILINNRKGCQDCVCPALANSIVPPVNIGLPPAPHIQTGHSPSSKTLGTFVSELSERKSSVATRPIISVDGPSSPGTAGPPSSPSFVGPPSGRTAIAPPAPSVSLVSSPISLLPVKAFPSVKQESIDTLQVNQFDIDAKQILPPPFTAQLQEKCMQPVEPGPCKHFVDRWFFNSDDGTCHPFKYGGCAGNRNHFFTQKECEIHCARFLRILPEDEDKELVDETPTPSRSVVVAGVTQVHINEPLTVENYNSPNPPLRADKDDSSYGETILHTHAISNAMSTTVISTKSNDLNELKEVEVKDESSSSTSFKIPLSTQFFVENTDITRKTVMNASTISVTPSPLITNEPSTTAFVSTESITNATTSITPILSTELPVKSTSSSVDYAVNPTVTTTQDNQLNYVKSTFSITKQESVEQVTNVMGENTNEDFATTITTTTPTKTEVEPSTTITNEIESIEDESEEFTPSTNSKEISSLSEVTNIPSQEVQVRNIMTSSKFHTENVLKETEEKVVDEKVEFFNRSSIQPPSSENEYKPISVSKPISEKIHQTNSATLKKIVIAGKTKSPITSTLVTENATTPSSTITTTTTTTTLHFVPSTTVETNEITRHSDAKSERLPEVNAAGVSLFEPKEPEKILKPDIFAVKHVGREPVPSEAVGIGRNMASLDIDNLDEPTTIIPITTTTERLRNTTYNRASTSTPYKSSSTSISPRPESITQGNEVIERAKTAQPSNPTHAENVADPSTHTLRADSYDPRIICAMPPDAGTCFNYVPRWFFNAQTGQCEQFSFGSCGGNLNNFADRTTCELKCIQAHSSVLSQVPERCSFSKDGGFGKGYNVKWYFNMRNLRCEQFVYEGQGGNSNQFETLSDCERFCSPQPGSVKHLPTTTALKIRPESHNSEVDSKNLPSLIQPPIISTIEQAKNVEDINESDYENDSAELLDPLSKAYKLHSPVPARAIPTSLPTLKIPAIPSSLPTVLPPIILSPIAPSTIESTQPPSTEPRPPAIQAAKTVTQDEVDVKEIPIISAVIDNAKKDIYKAVPLPSKPILTGNEDLPIVGPSPPMSVNYQTGAISHRASGIRTFQESNGRISIDNSDLNENLEKTHLPSCPNGIQEIRYADGRAVMCLPGKNQCPEKSVCYFNGMDYFCCPNEEDPYDKHVFGGYNGEETKHGYKVFGPLNIRRLMDDIPIRARRNSLFSREKREAVKASASVSFNIDSVVAPLRFDDEKPRQVSRALHMRNKPRSPDHGNPICILPLIKGACSEAHLRYYYDRNSDSCQLFYYTGCQGNGNNFGSLEDCQKLCVLEGQQVTSSLSSIISPGQCGDGKPPLGGSTPVLCGNSTDSIGCPLGFYCRSGPPDVCCPGYDIKKSATTTEVRFAPEANGSPRGYSRVNLLSTPKFMCPDASDPLMNKTGEPVLCGAGFDGMKLCPKGFYCAIDVEKESRLCCPLYGAAQRIPAEQVVAPYFGRRHSNPGEVIERGSLPLDQVQFQKERIRSFTEETQPFEKITEKKAEPVKITLSTQASVSISLEDEDVDSTDEDEKEDDMAHLMLKPLSPHGNTLNNGTPEVSVFEPDGLSIDIGTTKISTVIEEVTSGKTTSDKSVCYMKPSEGRACREDEKPPRTNLHYFYSSKDRRCKLYFYKGCGGNENRFEKKADCQALCL